MAVMESRARARQSHENAKEGRNLSMKLMQVNRSLDFEMERLFENLVRKQGQNKVEQLPVLSVGDVARGQALAGGICSICGEDLQLGDKVRSMACCGSQQHAGCLRAHLKTECFCPAPKCRSSILTSNELRELMDGCN